MKARRYAVIASLVVVALLIGTGMSVAIGSNSMTSTSFAQGVSDFWSLTGNAGTTAGVNFLGTTDDEPLELHVNGQRALRIEPGVIPNMLGGPNGVGADIIGATISGGGDAFEAGIADCSLNSVTGDLGTIVGGAGNIAGGRSFVGGGLCNEAPSEDSVISGGNENLADGRVSTIGGGANNSAGAFFSTVGGGFRNSVQGEGATVSGGRENTASGRDSTVGGGHVNNASGDHSTIAGGSTNESRGKWSAIGGGLRNFAGGGDFATVSGGSENIANSSGATVGGGSQNQAQGDHSTVSGGQGNIATGEEFNTVGGGFNNFANGSPSTVAGGYENRAEGLHVTIAGGRDNVARGGTGATIGGGQSNRADGENATVSGGFKNSANGDFSFAAGRRAKVDADHDGTFLFADSNNLDFNSAAANEFAGRATGGVRFVTAIDGDGNPTAGVQLAPGDSAWSALSDRNAKANFAPVDGRDILERLSSIPVETWNYQSQDPSIRHIGPMAQDFHAAFGVGGDDRRINTVDADGVSLAAIQGLYEIVQEKDAEIAALESRIAALEEDSGAQTTLFPFSASVIWTLAGSLGMLLVTPGLILSYRRMKRDK